MVVNILKNIGLKKNDKVLIYSSTYLYVNSIKKYADSIKNIKIAVDVVEWHQPFQFKFGNIDLRYISYKKCFYKLYLDINNIISISEKLDKHFKQKGCNVIKYPIYTDTKNTIINYKKSNDQLNLIYPGNPYRKDSLLIMLLALNLLTDREKKKVKFHLTGVSKKLLYKCVPKNEYLIDELEEKGVLIIHSWLEYEELMQLYTIIDFALIARPNNIVTNSNFPSKVPELMSKGIPIIINNVGDIIDYLEDKKDSIIFNGESYESCFQAIKYCLSLKATEIEKMHKNAYEKCSQVFDYRKSAKVLDEFFKKLL